MASKLLSQDLCSGPLVQPTTESAAEIDIVITNMHDETLNHLAPINTLPPELLGRIFLEYALQSSHGAKVYSLRWANTILYVCRRWFIVAMRHQALWSRIQVDFLDLFHRSNYQQVMGQLKQSGLSPLMLDMVLRDDREIPHVVAVLEPHAARIEALSFNPVCEQHRIAAFLEAIKSWSLPSIHSFALQTADPQEHVHIPGNMLNTQMSCLRADNCTFDWDLLGGLRILIVRHVTAQTIPTTFRTLISAFERAPRLEEIELWMPVVAPRDPTMYTVNLPLLRSLNLKSTAQTCHAVVSSITIPPTASLGLSLTDITEAKDMRILLISCRKHVRSSGALTIRHILLFIVPFSTTVSFFTTTTPGSPFPMDAMSRPYLSLKAGLAGKQRRKGIKKILKAAAIDKTVTHLNAQYVVDDIGQRCWKEILQLMPVMEVLYLSDNVSAISLSAALINMFTFSATATNSEVANNSEVNKYKKPIQIPALRAINVQFVSKSFAHTMDHVEDLSDQVVAALLGVLAAYKEHGRPIATVKIQTKGMSDSVFTDAQRSMIIDLVDTFVLDDSTMY